MYIHKDMIFTRLGAGALAALLLLAGPAAPSDDFRVLPYLQNPSRTAMTVIWFSEGEMPGRVTFGSTSSSSPRRTASSLPERAASLTYPAWERETFFAETAPPPPYRHRVRLTGLNAGATYSYTVTQGGSSFSSQFTAAPAADRPVRLIFYANCETEPESTGAHVEWADPAGLASGRTYLLDQTDGFAGNLRIIAQRRPDLIAIAGGLVQSGGEQRDWDEFWRHLTRPDRGGAGLASSIPVVAAPGSHDYLDGPKLGVHEPGSERAIGRYLTYFEHPSNGARHEQEGRYYSLDYGPVTIISLDVANDSPSQSGRDTNFLILGEDDPDGGQAPAFGPGSRQYRWLRRALERAQSRSSFTFVIFHRVLYSAGPHGRPPGKRQDENPQPGVAVRRLTPLFIRYGVDAVMAGHDEIWERSEIEGVEVLPGGVERDHTLQVYDVGTSGDGLRAPEAGVTNPQQRFLVHRDAPEVWREGVLVSGGKHYGHLEVNVHPLEGGGWQAVLTPAYAFPIFDRTGYVRTERRVYDDVQTLRRASGPIAPESSSRRRGDDVRAPQRTNPAVQSRPERLRSDYGAPSRPRASRVALRPTAPSATLPGAFSLASPFISPFDGSVLVRYSLPRKSPVRLELLDSRGAPVTALVDAAQEAGFYSVEWSARETEGERTASGVYLIRMTAGAFSDSVEIAID